MSAACAWPSVVPLVIMYAQNLRLAYGPSSTVSSTSSPSASPVFERFISPPSPALPGRMRICRSAMVPSGITSNVRCSPAVIEISKPLYIVLLSFVVCERLKNQDEAAAPGLVSLLNKFAEMRLLDLVEAAAAILRGPVPLVRRGADEAARQHAVAEVDPVHGDDLVEDAGQLAPGAGAFELQAMLGPLKSSTTVSRMPSKTTLAARACCKCSSHAIISRPCSP